MSRPEPTAINPDAGYRAWKAARDERIARNSQPPPPAPDYVQETAPKAPEPSRPECGTLRGLRMHHHYKDPACTPCLDARKQAQAELAEAQGKKPRKPTPRPEDRPAPSHNICGSPSGYKKHMKLKETACYPCVEAQTEYSRQRRAGLRKPRRVAQCGTVSGHQKHRKEKTPVCDPCRDAHNAKQREYRDRRNNK